VIRRGNPDGESLVSARPEELTAVLDLELWRPATAGQDERFDAERFAEWLDLIIDADESASARILANMNVEVAVAGFSRHVRVFDPGAREPTAASDDEWVESAVGRGDLTCELGGYLVIARRRDTWESMIAALLALEAEDEARFHVVMEGCRRLSNSAPEIDGLDTLLDTSGQHLHDVSIEREQRLAQRGFCAPGDARVFLQTAREGRADRSAAPAPPVAAEPTLALVEAGESSPGLPHLRAFMARARDADEAGWLTHHSEMAHLANTLIAGSALLSRAFTPREAAEAAAATCNLGLEQADAFPPDLVTAFEAGLSMLHRNVCMYSARRLMDTLSALHGVAPGIEDDLRALELELRTQCEAGTPWRARDALEVMATLDVVAWTGLLGLISECPVIPEAVTASVERRKSAVSATNFEFISTTAQLDTVRTFMTRLPELL
jgi:hypothetical protein